MLFHALGCGRATSPPTIVSHQAAGPSGPSSTSISTGRTKRKSTSDSLPALDSPAKRKKSTASAVAHLEPAASASGSPVDVHRTVSIPHNQDQLQAHARPKPGFPGSDVHAFVAGLPLLSPEDPYNFDLFAKLGMAGIKEKDDLEMLTVDFDRARDFLTGKGVSFLQWIVVRHGLLARTRRRGSDPNQNVEIEAEMLDFLKQRSPSLEHLSPILRDIGLTYSDVKHLYSLRGTWPALGKYLISQGFKFAEFVAFKRGLLGLYSPAQDLVDLMDPSHHEALKTFLADVKGDAKSKIDSFMRVGFCYREDLDMLSTLPAERIDEVLDGLVKEGLSWSECKAVQDALHRRAESLKVD
ncbi:hypothetical protein EIP91_012111 [Steccherinum ochraceum]|uniref:Uncharacterized protein n=1 Tax=Steccherinum ochraceum TaxID=92696 RepID=A0A4R0RUF0_9APHY|nr:hypothetical protein EIP91_012111 [Steccherinum ochraceum]